MNVKHSIERAHALNSIIVHTLEPTHECKQCGMFFVSHSGLYAHKNNVHKESCFQCPKCVYQGTVSDAN